MATVKLDVTTEWQKVTEGTNSTVLQYQGIIDLCDNPTKPADNTEAFLTFSSNDKKDLIAINPPVMAWIRAGGFCKKVTVVKL